MERKITGTDLLARRLRLARQARCLDQTELAELSGVPRSSISRFEGGRRRPSVGHLRKLVVALNVPADFLLGRVDHLDQPRPAGNELEALGQLKDLVADAPVTPADRKQAGSQSRSFALVGLTARIISAYVSNNVIPHDRLPGLINAAHGALSRARVRAEPPGDSPQYPCFPPVPANDLPGNGYGTGPARGRPADGHEKSRWHKSLGAPPTIHIFSNRPVAR